MKHSISEPKGRPENETTGKALPPPPRTDAEWKEAREEIEAVLWRRRGDFPDFSEDDFKKVRSDAIERLAKNGGFAGKSAAFSFKDWQRSRPKTKANVEYIEDRDDRETHVDEEARIDARRRLKQIEAAGDALSESSVRRYGESEVGALQQAVHKRCAESFRESWGKEWDPSFELPSWVFGDDGQRAREIKSWDILEQLRKAIDDAAKLFPPKPPEMPQPTAEKIVGKPYREWTAKDKDMIRGLLNAQDVKQDVTCDPAHDDEYLGETWLRRLVPKLEDLGVPSRDFLDNKLSENKKPTQSPIGRLDVSPFRRMVYALCYERPEWLPLRLDKEGRAIPPSVNQTADISILSGDWPEIKTWPLTVAELMKRQTTKIREAFKGYSLPTGES